MIEINLLPHELRVTKLSFNKLSPETLLYLIPAVFAVLVISHIYLAIVSVYSGLQFKSLTRKWQEFEPQRKALESASSEYAGFTQVTEGLKQAIKDRVNWSEKLNLLSYDLPSGIWFNEIRFSGKDFFLKASAFSTTKQEINLINKFLDNLEADGNFSREFSQLELGPVQKVTVGSYEAAEFTINGKFK